MVTKELIMKYIYDKKAWIYRATLIILCMIHDYTKYKTARNIKDLFYWPEGICWDMAVISAFFIIAAACLYNDLKLVKAAVNDVYR